MAFLRLSMVAMLLMALASSACTTNRAARFDMSSGEPEQFKRYTGRPAVDYIHRWGGKAFHKVEVHVDDVLSADKKDVLSRCGQPDYVRDDVPASRPEIFDEWVYWDRNTICQFIQGELVYEGPLLDSDRWLVTYGYPRRAFIQQYEAGPVRELWIYEKLFDLRERQVSFSDGKLVFQSQQ